MNRICCKLAQAIYGVRSRNFWVQEVKERSTSDDAKVIFVDLAEASFSTSSIE